MRTGAGVRSGSSPLTRGKYATVSSDCRRSGLIPAHAGKMRRARQVKATRRAHPRSRGENSCALVGQCLGPGSSPLTRGKCTRLRQCLYCAGLIPAHAGKIGTGWGQGRAGRAHPRSRGENRHGHSARPGRGGSSPLTRGKSRQPPRSQPAGRLIPAHAGKISLHTGRAMDTRAHPRSRGENIPTHRQGDGHTGSSPLTRGKSAADSVPSTRVGLIPAHAGKMTGTMP